MTQTTVSNRRYIPSIGARVKLAQYSDYSALWLPAWTVLTCMGVDGENVTCIRSLTANGEHDGDLVVVPLSRIEPPIGWSERYTIHVSPDKVNEVLGWMKRGIVVRQSQYIGDGSTAFQPLDNSETPHWKYGEITDTIPSEKCTELIRVVKLETIWDAFIPAPCRYCEGKGIHTPNPSLNEQTLSKDTCPECGVHLHFSFTEPWHERPNEYHLDKPNAYCDKVKPAGYCWVCQGTGNGARYLSEIPPKERKQVIKTLESERWKVWYQKRGQSWRMERETTVKEFGQEVTPETTTPETPETTNQTTTETPETTNATNQTEVK